MAFGRYVMVGAFKGKTVTLGGRFPFTNGVMEVNATEKDLALLDKHLSQWEAVRNGNGSLQGDGSPEVQGDGEPSGAEVTTGDPAANGKEPAGAETSDKTVGLDPVRDRQETRLREVLLGLDPKDNTLWTASGKPNIQELERLSGQKGLTRKVIEAVIPGFVRPKETSPEVPPVPEE